MSESGSTEQATGKDKSTGMPNGGDAVSATRPHPASTDHNSDSYSPPINAVITNTGGRISLRPIVESPPPTAPPVTHNDGDDAEDGEESEGKDDVSPLGSTPARSTRRAKHSQLSRAATSFSVTSTTSSSSVAPSFSSPVAAAAAAATVTAPGSDALVPPLPAPSSSHNISSSATAAAPRKSFSSTIQTWHTDSPVPSDLDTPDGFGHQRTRSHSNAESSASSSSASPPAVGGQASDTHTDQHSYYSGYSYASGGGGGGGRGTGGELDRMGRGNLVTSSVHTPSPRPSPRRTYLTLGGRNSGALAMARSAHSTPRRGASTLRGALLLTPAMMEKASQGVLLSPKVLAPPMSPLAAAAAGASLVSPSSASSSSSGTLRRSRRRPSTSLLADSSEEGRDLADLAATMVVLQRANTDPLASGKAEADGQTDGGDGTANGAKGGSESAPTSQRSSIISPARLSVDAKDAAAAVATLRSPPTADAAVATPASAGATMISGSTTSPPPQPMPLPLPPPSNASPFADLVAANESRFAAGGGALMNTTRSHLFRPDAMISYSRRDLSFVRLLVAHFEASGRKVWVDYQRIPTAVDFMSEITAGIRDSGAFIYVLSPDSVASKYCDAELDAALQMGKRIIPLVVKEVDVDKVRPEVRGLNWLFCCARNTAAASSNASSSSASAPQSTPAHFLPGLFPTLLASVLVDPSYVRMHTRLLVRASEWEENEEDPSFLAEGRELEEANRWMDKAREVERLQNKEWRRREEERRKGGSGAGSTNASSSSSGGFSAAFVSAPLPTRLQKLFIFASNERVAHRARREHLLLKFLEDEEADDWNSMQILEEEEDEDGEYEDWEDEWGEYGEEMEEEEWDDASSDSSTGGSIDDQDAYSSSSYTSDSSNADESGEVESMDSDVTTDRSRRGSLADASSNEQPSPLPTSSSSPVSTNRKIDFNTPSTSEGHLHPRNDAGLTNSNSMPTTSPTWNRALTSPERGSLKSRHAEKCNDEAQTQSKASGGNEGTNQHVSTNDTSITSSVSRRSSLSQSKLQPLLDHQHKRKSSRSPASRGTSSRMNPLICCFPRLNTSSRSSPRSKNGRHRARSKSKSKLKSKSRAKDTPGADGRGRSRSRAKSGASASASESIHKHSSRQNVRGSLLRYLPHLHARQSAFGTMDLSRGTWMNRKDKKKDKDKDKEKADGKASDQATTLPISTGLVALLSSQAELADSLLTIRKAVHESQAQQRGRGRSRSRARSSAGAGAGAEARDRGTTHSILQSPQVQRATESPSKRANGLHVTLQIDDKDKTQEEKDLEAQQLQAADDASSPLRGGGSSSVVRSSSESPPPAGRGSRCRWLSCFHVRARSGRSPAKTSAANAQSDGAQLQAAAPTVNSWAQWRYRLYTIHESACFHRLFRGVLTLEFGMVLAMLVLLLGGFTSSSSSSSSSPSSSNNDDAISTAIFVLRCVQLSALSFFFLELVAFLFFIVRAFTCRTMAGQVGPIMALVFVIGIGVLDGLSWDCRTISSGSDEDGDNCTWNLFLWSLMLRSWHVLLRVSLLLLHPLLHTIHALVAAHHQNRTTITKLKTMVRILNGEMVSQETATKRKWEQLKSFNPAQRRFSNMLVAGAAASNGVQGAKRRAGRRKKDGRDDQESQPQHSPSYSPPRNSSGGAQPASNEPSQSPTRPGTNGPRITPGKKPRLSVRSPPQYRTLPLPLATSSPSAGSRSGGGAAAFNSGNMNAAVGLVPPSGLQVSTSLSSVPSITSGPLPPTRVSGSMFETRSGPGPNGNGAGPGLIVSMHHRSESEASVSSDGGGGANGGLDSPSSTSSSGSVSTPSSPASFNHRVPTPHGDTSLSFATCTLANTLEAQTRSPSLASTREMVIHEGDEEAEEEEEEEA